MREFFLRTVRIGFSIWNEKDLADALELWGNPEVTQFIVAEGKMSQEQVHQRLKKEIATYHHAHIQYWPIYSIETIENLGCCGLRPYDPKNNILEMGIHLKPNYWGKGVAQEACSAIIEYAFNVLRVNALFAGHNPTNVASARLLKKLGLHIPTMNFIHQPDYIILHI